MFSIGRTQYDLNFSVLGIPVRVHPAFWAVGAIMGFSQDWADAIGQNVLVIVIVWLACLFVSILVHEMGHALMARRFGWPPNVLLYHFGGLASYTPTRGYSPLRSIAISLAGPGAGFVLFGVVVGLEQLLLQSDSPLIRTDPAGVRYVNVATLAGYTLVQMKFINLYWGLVNLLPVLPLDGGRVCEQVLSLAGVSMPFEKAVKVSLVVAGVAGLFFLAQERQYAGVLFLILAVNNYQSMQGMRGRRWS